MYDITKETKLTKKLDEALSNVIEFLPTYAINKPEEGLTVTEEYLKTITDKTQIIVDKINSLYEVLNDGFMNIDEDLYDIIKTGMKRITNIDMHDNDHAHLQLSLHGTLAHYIMCVYKKLNGEPEYFTKIEYLFEKYSIAEYYKNKFNMTK
jgi:hypothetical protein